MEFPRLPFRCIIPRHPDCDPLVPIAVITSPRTSRARPSTGIGGDYSSIILTQGIIPQCPNPGKILTGGSFVGLHLYSASPAGGCCYVHAEFVPISTACKQPVNRAVCFFLINEEDLKRATEHWSRCGNHLSKTHVYLQKFTPVRYFQLTAEPRQGENKRQIRPNRFV